MKVWINADIGCDIRKMEIAALLEKRGWDVYVGRTAENAHYSDYFNVTEDYQYYMTIYNGFCAGTVREACSSGIQAVLKEKGVTLAVTFDTAEWLEGMRPYRYGDFRGYRARRSWQDNFSKTDPLIPNVDAFFREHHTVYCAGPTADIIVDQFEAGGYLQMHNKNETMW